MKLKKQHILLCITGGIAAYKAAELARLLIKAGAEVRVVMTRHACEFVQPLTFETLTQHPTFTHEDCFDKDEPMRHIELARWADLMLIAPATANTISKLATGMADDLINTIYLATKAPVLIAPAMNQHMWENPATQANLHTLQSREITVLTPGVGEQACGDNGPGRMPEPEAILGIILASCSEKVLEGKNIVITAGPTREWIDPVRYISNASSGKMGWALADAAETLGASVTLIIGPNTLTPLPDVNTLTVTSAQDMHDAVMSHMDSCDWFIGAAAVSDYTPVNPANRKLKKHDETLTLTLKKSPDIIQAVANLPNKPLTIGFALETNDLLKNAKQKLQRKNLDFILANTVGEAEGFNSNQNTLHLIDKSTTIIADYIGLKTEIAFDILNQIHALTHKETTS